MKRISSKRSADRRKKIKGKTSLPRQKMVKSAPGDPAEDRPQDACRNCLKDLRSVERALFVEEEVGRMFCSESCIAGYFTPEIERLEREYFRKLSPNDLGGEERENLAHLRWITLQEPDEIWREKTVSGDFRFTLISEFQPEDKKVWCICICLFLRGQPSFLYLAFSTQNSAMTNSYRKGERVELVKADAEVPQKDQRLTDGLAGEWTEDETLRAQLGMERREDDIPPEEFGLYQSCLEETLQVPDEVWSLAMTGRKKTCLYHFIRFYSEGLNKVWYIVVARETDDEEQIEILDAFPTRDLALVDQYRKGNQEVGPKESRLSSSRVVH